MYPWLGFHHRSTFRLLPFQSAIPSERNPAGRLIIVQSCTAGSLRISMDRCTNRVLAGVAVGGAVGGAIGESIRHTAPSLSWCVRIYVLSRLRIM